MTAPNMAKVIALLAGVISGCLVRSAHASDTVADKTESYVAASSNLQVLTASLHENDKLWPQEPAAWGNFIRKVSAAVAESGNPMSKQMLMLAFTNTIDKSIPTNSYNTTSCLTVKCDILLCLLAYDEIRDEKTTWIALAKYIGEIRAQIITNYVNQGFVNPPGAMNSSEDDARKAVQDNQRKVAFDRFQLELRVTDRKLSIFLLNNVRRFSADTDFMRQIVSYACLTQAEQLRVGTARERR